MMRAALGCLLGLAATTGSSAGQLDARATGHDSRIDLVWELPAKMEVEGWVVWRAGESTGPLEHLNEKPRPCTVFSDFLGENGRQFFYRITGLRGATIVCTSAILLATSRSMTDDELLTSVQEATFRYFWHSRVELH